MEIRLRSVGTWGLGLAVFYAVFVRFYQAAGGRIGLPARITEPERMEQASYVAGLVVLVGGAACLVLTGRWIRTLPRPLVLTGVAAPSVVGGGFALAHGVAGTIANALELAGAITIDKPLMVDPTPAERAADAWWNIAFYGPWFAAMGACLLLSAAAYARAVGVPDRVRRRATVAALTATAVLTGLIVVAMATGTRVAVV